METIQSLAGISKDLLFKSFSRAFEDYELQLNQAELQRMLRRRGFNPGSSVNSA